MLRGMALDAEIPNETIYASAWALLRISIRDRVWLSKKSHT